MMTVQGCFDLLHFSECNFEKIEKLGSTLSIKVSGIYPLHGYPLSDLKGPISGMLVFKGVVLSRRTITEYIGNPKNPIGYKEPYVVEEYSSDSDSSTISEYVFEGVQEMPEAWVDEWTVRAESFELVIET